MATALVFAALLPIAHGFGAMQGEAAFGQGQSISPISNASRAEQNMNIIHANRIDVLSRITFAPRVNPLPKPKPHDLRSRRAVAIEHAAAEIARTEGVPPDLFIALVFAESSFNPSARSRVGAIGLTQLMPATARELGVNPHDPVQNLVGGARYLRRQYERFGSWQLALAAYNAGPGRVVRAGGVPNIRETRNYVRKIITLASL